MNSLRQRLIKNETTVGSWITMGSHETTEIMATANFDWLTVDMEHSAIDLPRAQDLVRIIQGKGKPALVRVGANEPNIIKRALDLGVDGIIVPMIKSRAEAEAVVNAVYYPPQGQRGVGLTRAQGYGQGFDDYKERLKSELAVLVIIEHIQAIEELEEILTVDGIHGSMIGPYDLSGSLGHPGEYERPEVQEAIERYRTVCAQLNKPAGFHVIPPQAAALEKKVAAGFGFLGFSLDSLFLAENVTAQLAGMDLNLLRT